MTLLCSRLDIYRSTSVRVPECARVRQRVVYKYTGSSCLSISVQGRNGLNFY